MEFPLYPSCALIFVRAAPHLYLQKSNVLQTCNLVFRKPDVQLFEDLFSKQM